MLFYRAALSLSRQTLTYVGGIIRRHRATIGSLWRKLNPGQQAPLVLVHLRKGGPFAQVAAGFEVSTATAWRYVTETVALLSARAPKLRQAVRAAKKGGLPFVVLDDTLIRTDRVAADRGEVTLHGARIAGQLTFQDAVLEGTPLALHLRRLQADELCLRTARPITGAIWLAPARVGTLDDDPAVWPAEIWLSGFTYDVIRHGTGRVPVSERIDWVSRGPFGYQPRPYEQLADYYRRAGQDDDVRRVLFAKQRHQRTTLRAPGRAVGRLLDATVGYGYRPWLAAIWLALLLTAGTVVYSIYQPHALPGGPVPPFNPFAYTLDLLIPIGAFGLRNAYASTGPAQWLADALIAAGWILATAVIAGITRTVHRD